MQVQKGPNEFDGEEALQFAVTRRFPEVTGPPDFVRSANHQALLLGLLEGLQKQDDDKGFLETMALSAIEGIDTEDASPLDLYRLLNALTGVDPAKGGRAASWSAPRTRTRPATRSSSRTTTWPSGWAGEAIDDATFESGCEPSAS